VADLVSGLTLLPRIWRDVPHRSLWALIPAMWSGQVLGVELLVRLPVRWVEALIGVAVLSMALRLSRDTPPDEARPGSRAGAVLAGLLGGTMGGLVGMGGPPIVAWAARRFPPQQARAALVAIFAAGSIAQAVLLSGRGVLAIDATLLLIVPTTLAANAAGMALGSRLAPATFRRIVAALLVGSGLTLLAGTLP
jgi:uncharacterized membrane protein YfcA